jgi:hypothetical protein
MNPIVAMMAVMRWRSVEFVMPVVAVPSILVLLSLRYDQECSGGEGQTRVKRGSNQRQVDLFDHK